MRSLGRISISLLLAVTVLGFEPAHGGVLVEEYDGQRPADADRVLGPFRSQLKSFGWYADPSWILGELHGMPRSGNEDPSVTVASLVDRTNKAIRLAVHHQPIEAIKEFTTIYNLAKDNEAVVVRDPASAEWLTKVVVFSAYCHLQLSQDEKDKKSGADPSVIAEHDRAVDELLQEQIRSRPGRPVTSVDYGPSIERAYALARSHVEHDEPGNVSIHVSRPDAEVFIDETFRGRGAFVGALAPGGYRVLVRVGNEAIRYDLSVPSRLTKKLDIDWDLDRQITMSREWFGVAWPAGKTRTAALYRLLLDRLPPDGYIFVRIGAKNGKRYLAARFVRNGEVARRCAIELGGDEIIKSGDLYQCIMGNSPTNYIVEDPFDDDASASLPRRRTRPSRTRSWVAPTALVGGGTILAAVGVVLIYYGQQDGPDDRYVYTRATTIGVVATVGGVLAAAGGGVLFWRRSNDTGTAVSLVPTQSGGLVTLSGRF